ncbi:MAG: LCP family protein [Anaerovoracaceae bacterium]
MRSDKHKNKNNDRKKIHSDDRFDFLDDESISKNNYNSSSKNTDDYLSKSNDGLDFDRSLFGEVDEKALLKSEKKFQKEFKKSNKKKKKKRGKKKHSFLKFLLVLVLLIGVIAAGLFFYLNTKINKMDFIKTTPAEFSIDDNVDKSLSDYRNVAILGIDARKGEGFEGTRSDAIIIASINKKTNEVKLVSVLRDSYLYMGDGKGNYMLDKVTHAFAFGGAINTCATLNKALDLNISEFIVMDWNSVADVVDIFGGLKLDIKSNEIRDLNKWGPETARNTNRQWKNITTTGEQTLDGAQVATYCRIRKTSGGDEGRTNRMKKVTEALLKTAISNPTKIDKVLDEVLPEIQTNMGTTSFTTLLPHVASFNITKSIGWPKDFYGGIINGKWLAVPKTLESNVIDLHKKAFGQKNYILSDQAHRINQLIISDTGIQ